MRHTPSHSTSRFLGGFISARLCDSGSPCDMIFKRYMQFVDKPSACVAAIIHKPLGITAHEGAINRFFGEDVAEHINIINRIVAEDKKILEHPDLYQDMIILYLIDFEYYLVHANLCITEKKKMFGKKIAYAKNILNVCAAGAITTRLGDEFFAIAYPRLYEKYMSLFDSNRDAYHRIEQRAAEVLRGLLRSDHVMGRVQSRTKSISSLHEKIKKKNLLPTQIFDLIGLRVLVRTKKDCYRALETILIHWSTHHARVKDYIALPKENGYRSIHVTGEFEGKRVEIQIRTHKMHHQAQYGQAAHRIYKQKG